MWNRRIVVGADGSEGSSTAVRWAAREADRRGLGLLVVYVSDWPWHTARYIIGGDYLEWAHRHADAVTAAAVEEAQAVAPNLSVEVDALVGQPVPRLLDSAADGELLVVGNRGRGRVASLLFGSVSQRVAVRAPCPVVVVRGCGGVGPVAVGVDASAAADPVGWPGRFSAPPACRCCTTRTARSSSPGPGRKRADG